MPRRVLPAPVRFLVLAPGLVAGLVVGLSPSAAADGEILVDRIVAVVDDDPILLSDVERRISLGLAVPLPGETPAELRRRVLDSLVDERLRLHEVERYAAFQVSIEEVEAQLERVKKPLGEDFAGVLARLEIEEDALRHLLRRQLRILDYIEERLGPRVFIDLADIQTYYESELAAEMARRGEPTPPLEAVREDIRAVLYQRRLNEEIRRWTEELRLAADISDRLDVARQDPLPPVVLRLEDTGDE